jgi:hypothetical protein
VRTRLLLLLLLRRALQLGTHNDLRATWRLARALVASGAPTTEVDDAYARLVLAEPEGYVRTIVDEGPPMAALLGKHCGARKAIALLKRQDLIPVVERPPTNGRILTEPPAARTEYSLNEVRAERWKLKVLSVSRASPSISNSSVSGRSVTASGPPNSATTFWDK